MLVVFFEDLLDLQLELSDFLALLQVNIPTLYRIRPIKESVLLKELSNIEFELSLRLFRVQSVRFLGLILRGQGTSWLASLLPQWVGCPGDQLFISRKIFFVQEIIRSLNITRFQEFQEILYVTLRRTVLLGFAELLIAAWWKNIILIVKLKTINFSNGSPAIFAGLLLEEVV